MKRSIVIKKLTVALTILAFTVALFTSCHRGTGCPGQIGDEQPSEMKIEMEIADQAC